MKNDSVQELCGNFTFTDKTFMLTGGTVSFGNALLNRCLFTGIGEICIFSYDEKKQDGKSKFYIGDVRDFKSCHDSSLTYACESTSRWASTTITSNK